MSTGIIAELKGGNDKDRGLDMDFVSCREYRGVVKAVVLDVCGVVFDAGCAGCRRSLQELLERHGLGPLPEAQAPDAGGDARQQLNALFLNGPLAENFRQIKGRDFSGDDLDAFCKEHVAIRRDHLKNKGALIPGAMAFLEKMRKRGIKTALLSDYDRETLAEIWSCLECSESYDTCVCGDEYLPGPPAPWGIFRAMEKLDACPPESVVMISGNPASIRAANNAGVWSIGITGTGGLAGLSEEQLRKTGTQAEQKKAGNARQLIYQAGANYACFSIKDCSSVIKGIGRRLQNGASP